MKFINKQNLLVWLMCIISFSPLAGQPNTFANELLLQAQRGHSQTDAHLKDSLVRSRFTQYVGSTLDKNKNIILSALAKEREMVKKGYVVLYSAVPHFRLLQDVARKLYKQRIGNVGALQEKAFQFIRYTYNDPAYMQYSDATDFLNKEISREGIINDHITRVRTVLVSTNIAVFGNLQLKGESTYFYFNNPQPWATLNPAWLEASLKSYGYPTDYMQELLDLAAEFKSDKGDLFQFCIPLSLINKAGYVSWRHGIPFDVDFIKQLLGRQIIYFDEPDRIFMKEILEKTQEWQRKYKGGNPTVRRAVVQLLKKVEEGAFHIDPFIKHYVENKIEYMDAQQVRLVIGKWLLDPLSGIKIFRYSTLSPDKETQYKKKLSAIVKKMNAINQKKLIK